MKLSHHADLLLLDLDRYRSPRRE